MIAAASALVLAGCEKGLPQSVGPASLKLGMAAQEFVGAVSANEVASATKGVRTFTVNQNSLPDGFTQLRADFLENKLVALEGVRRLDKQWSTIIAEPIKNYGEPKTVVDGLGTDRLAVGTPSESVAWIGKKSTYVLGRGADVVFEATYDASWLPNLRDTVKGIKAADETAKAAGEAAKVAAKNEADAAQAAAKAAADTSKAAEDQVLAKYRAARTKRNDLFTALLADPWPDPSSALAASAEWLAALREYKATVKQPAFDPAPLETFLERASHSSEWKTVTIPANVGWRDVSIHVDANDRLLIHSRGQWKMGPLRSMTDADGESIAEYLVVPGPGGRLGQLVCRLVDGTAISKFIIGKSGNVVVKQGGRLECGPNDSEPANNFGSMELNIVKLPVVGRIPGWDTP